MRATANADLAISAFLQGLARFSTVAAALQAAREHYGVAHLTYHLAGRAGGVPDCPFVRTTYPDRWVARYLLNDYLHVDPVAHEGFRRSHPFFWHDLSLTSEHEDFFTEANDHGLGGSGYSIPVTDQDGRRALVSIAAVSRSDNWKSTVSRMRAEWQSLAIQLHRLAVGEERRADLDVPRLASRERQCLHWVALGKDYKDIALILGISEHTVRDYAKSARLKLGCCTLTAAVARAYHLRIITPWSSPTD